MIGQISCRFLQSALYGLLLGMLIVIPAVIAVATKMGTWAIPFVMIAYVGTVPATLSGFLTWSLFGGRLQPASGARILKCWLITTVVAYLLTPVWMAYEAGGETAVGRSVEFVGIGFLFTSPLVLPLLLLGAWLWARHLLPRLGGLRPASP